jgi:hypothetical protein
LASITEEVVLVRMDTEDLPHHLRHMAIAYLRLFDTVVDAE